MKKTDTSGLLAAGLSPRESAILDALADTKELMTITAIAKRTQLNRPAVYKQIDQLIEKKLVDTVITQKRTLYAFAGMDALHRWRALQDSAYEQYLTDLSKDGKVPTLPDDVQIFRGEHMKHVWEMVLERTPREGVFLRYDAYSPENPVTVYMPDGFYETIDQKKLERFVITNDALRNTPYKKSIVCASRQFPASFDAFEQGYTQFILDDMVAFIDLNSQTAYVIHNPTIASFHARVFQLMYSMLPE